ncbi:MAG TPA: amidohydrolase family protein [Ignavibacteriaceae bacterium]|nr:amidohydrolase family protein [Ignavibacteriaceae bacterium]
MIIRNVKIIGRNEIKSSIVIEGGRIKNILPADNTKLNNTNEEIRFNEAIAFPGLINSHDHLEFNLFPRLRNKIYNNYVEWGKDIHIQNKEIINRVKNINYKIRFKWGLYKNLICGVTTVVHHGNGKVIQDEDLPGVYSKYNYLHSIMTEKNWAYKLNTIFNGKPFVIHIGEGRNGISLEEIEKLIRWNVFSKKLIGIHAVSMNERQAGKFKAIVWCPDSNIFLYNKTADIKSLKSNTEIIFGTDSNVSADWNIWNHLRLARQFNQLDDLELFNAVTSLPAKVWNIQPKGEIQKNCVADIVIAENKSTSPIDSFFAIDPEKILLVIKNGLPLLVDERLVNCPLFKNKRLDKISIKDSTKFITRGIIELVNDIKAELPDYKFPFSIN